MAMDGFISRLRTSLSRGRGVTLPEDPKAASRTIVAAIFANDSRTLEELLSAATFDVNTTYHRTKRTFLLAAAQTDAYECLSILLKRGADPNQADISGVTPLIAACRNGHKKCVKKLVSCKTTQLDLLDSNGLSAMNWLAVSGRYDCLVECLPYIKDINKLNHDGMSFLSAATKNGHISTVQFLLDNGADVNIKTMKGETPLHFACSNGQVQLLPLLVERQAEYVMDNNRRYPLQYAVESDNTGMVVALLTKYPHIVTEENLLELVTNCDVNEEQLYAAVESYLREVPTASQRILVLLCNHSSHSGLNLFSMKTCVEGLRCTIMKCVRIIKRLLNHSLLPQESVKLIRQSMVDTWSIMEGWLNLQVDKSDDIIASEADTDIDSMVDMLGRVCSCLEAYYAVCIVDNDPRAVGEFLRFVVAHENVIEHLIKRDPSVIFEYLGFLMENQDLNCKLIRLVKIQSLEARKAWFYRSLLAESSLSVYSPDSLESITVSRQSLFASSCHEMLRRDPHDLKHFFSIKFSEEDGVGTGVVKEWFDALSQELLNPDYGLFTVSPDGTTFQPNPASSVNPDHLNYFNFAGQIIGLALYHKHLVDVYFTRSFYKHILAIPLSYRDIESVDPEYYRNLCWILENDISDLGLDLTFSIESSEFGVTKVVPLKPSGDKILVTDQNKHEYVKLVTDLKMRESIQPQIDSFLQGFHKYIPEKLIKAFDEYELELILSGIPVIDKDDWCKNTVYNGYEPSSPIIQWFWEVIEEWNTETRVQLLQFTTGSSRVPLGGFAKLRGSDGEQKFIISQFAHSHSLPTSSTCVNMLKLPEYSSKEELRSKLIMAMEGSYGFGYA